MPYLNGTAATAEADLERYKLLTIMAAADVDDLEQLHEGWHAANFEQATAWINARLTKRYPVPYARPCPDVCEGWLVDIVTLRAFMRKGVRQTDEQFQEAVRADKRARDEVLEAAGSVTGLFGLPSRTDPAASGITKGGPRSYSEASPYVQFDVQGDRAQSEDLSRRGS